MSSLIKLDSLKFVTLLNNVHKKINYKDFTKIKIMVKQSYLLLTWLLYSKNAKSKFFIMPKKRKKFTLTKSPMAHKTFSQEQFKWEKYNVVISYNLKINSGLNSKYESMNFLLKQRNSARSSYLGSNLLFLDKIDVKVCFLESQFFKV